MIDATARIDQTNETDELSKRGINDPIMLTLELRGNSASIFLDDGQLFALSLLIFVGRDSGFINDIWDGAYRLDADYSTISDTYEIAIIRNADEYRENEMVLTRAEFAEFAAIIQNPIGE